VSNGGHHDIGNNGAISGDETMTVQAIDKRLTPEANMTPAAQAQAQGATSVEDAFVALLQQTTQRFGHGLSGSPSPGKLLSETVTHTHLEIKADRVQSARDDSQSDRANAKDATANADAKGSRATAKADKSRQTQGNAQAAKKALIGRKLLIKPGMKTLDIGSGWGGLSMTLAKDFGAQMTGVTLSTEQLALAKERAEKAGLADKTDFRLTDYRDLDEKFDRIVSVGMLEHVGAPNFRTYFETIAKLLDDDGVALVHSIGKMHGPGATNAFTQKYIFPGGYIPGLSEIVAAIEHAGLWITDIEILRLHYAETCRIWRERFMADPDIPTMFDARFRRMWEFYLAGAELGFRHGGHMVFQIQLAKKRDATPLTRDYLLKA